MLTLPNALRRDRLPRPRLLPATMLAITALLAMKSVVLVRAVAGETSQQPTPAQTGQKQAPATATAQSTSLAAGPSATATEPATAAPPSRQDGPDQTAPPSDAERRILLDLRHRRMALDARARDLDQREAELAAADRHLSDRIQQLAALQSRLETLETNRQQHSAENWAGLVKVYEAMKARDAAAIFDVLDMQVLLQVLDRMQERRAAAVLAAMQPDRARLATQMLAELRTRATTPDARPKG